jgi:hypothetical protein
VSIASKDADEPYFCLACGGFAAERGEISHIVCCMPCVSFFLGPRGFNFSLVIRAAAIKITPKRGYSSMGRRHFGQRSQ